MKFLTRISLFVIAVGFYVGCSEVKFSTKPSEACQQIISQFGFNTCISNPLSGAYDLDYTIETGRVDILFIDDNSGSMYTEQTQMANRFPTFLDSIAALDWNIAITTTDISGGYASTNGNFLKFPSGVEVINKNTANVEQEFKDTIERPETRECDTSDSDSLCPSRDERGIYAANLVINKANPNFFRSDTHLGLVFLSDEDQRSNGAVSGYPLEAYDRPEALVSNLKTVFPTKIMSAHSVIIEPGDTACLNAQNSQSRVSGYEGFLYQELSEPSPGLMELGNIVPGHVGSICASDYGVQLGDIGSKISQNVNVVQLACEPQPNTLEISYIPAVPGQPFSPPVDANNQVTLQPPATVGVKVNIKYTCDKL